MVSGTKLVALVGVIQLLFPSMESFRFRRWDFVIVFTRRDEHGANSGLIFGPVLQPAWLSFNI